MVESAIQEQVTIPVGSFRLTGELKLPQHSSSLVIFLHDSGSSRFSPRNQAVAISLQRKGIGTFLFDLLTEDEDSSNARLNIDMLSERLFAVTNWLLAQPYANDLGIGYFGASTGATSVLIVAAHLGRKVKAIVTQGGKPDLAMPYLHRVKAPTLLIVGSWDSYVLDQNRRAYNNLGRPKELLIISGAGHLFEESGKQNEVARYSGEWFAKYL